MPSAKKSLHSTKEKKHELVRYSKKAAMQALEILKRNNFNYLQTSKEVGVARQTLKRWAVDYNLEILSNLSTTDVEKRETEPVEDKKTRFERLACETKEELLIHIRNKAKSCKDVRKLSVALKTVHDVMTIKIVPPGDDNPDGFDQGIQLMEQIKRQITLKTK